MLVTELYNYFFTLIDEGDLTAVTPTDAEGYLRQGYREFRQLVIDADPEAFLTYVDITMSGVTAYALTSIVNPVTIMGAGPLTGPRLLALIDVATVTGTDEEFMTPVPTIVDLQSIANSYCLRATVLTFSESKSATIRLYYIPEESVDWTKHASGDTEFIDDFTGYHKLIALLAARTFFIRDWSTNPQFERQFIELKLSLQNFIGVGVNQKARQYVLPDRRGW